MLTRRRFALLASASALLLAGAALAAPVTVPAPGPGDKCPVCGMFVAPYPEWTATVQLDGGRVEHFDGCKCLFKYLLAPERFAPGSRPGVVATVAVKDYYGLAMIDARQASFVVGSDVLGPMGHELIPLASPTEARDFVADHGGRGPIAFGEVTPALLLALDRGEFR